MTGVALPGTGVFRQRTSAPRANAKNDDDAPSDADKARDEQAKQEESGQENPT